MILASWGPPGTLLGALLGSLGGLLGRLLAVLGLSWAMLVPSGPSWGVIRSLLGPSGAFWERLGALWGRLGPSMGRSRISLPGGPRIRPNQFSMYIGIHCINTDIYALIKGTRARRPRARTGDWGARGWVGPPGSSGGLLRTSGVSPATPPALQEAPRELLQSGR